MSVDYGSLIDSGRFPYASPAQAADGYVVLTTDSDVEVIAAQGVNTRIYVTSIIASNTSADPVRLDIKDGTTVVFSVLLAANGGGFSHSMPYPWKLLNNSPVVAALSTAVTDVRVAVHGFTLP